MIQYKILIVEDDCLLRGTLQKFLGVYHHVETAESLAKAREIFGNAPFDAILLDKTLPDGSGLSWLPEVRASSPSTAVLILTGDDDLQAVSKALSSGAEDYVLKSEQIILHLLIRIPVAVKNAADRLQLAALENKPPVHLPVLSDDITPENFGEYQATCERAFLERCLQVLNGDIMEVSKRISVSRSTIFRKLSESGSLRKSSRNSVVEQSSVDMNLGGGYV